MEDFEELSADHQRLDGLLTDLGEGGMMLSELDGYLCGIAVSPQVFSPEAFLPMVWSGVEGADETADRSALTDAVMARFGEISAELAEGRYEPLYELDEDEGVLWEVWIAGFEAAISLDLPSWESLLQSRKESRAQEAAYAIMSLLAASDPAISEEDASDPEMIRLQQDAPHLIPEIVVTLFEAHRSAAQAPIRSAAVGRNDPCPCGSGLKYKKCHGAG
ncbi:MAG: UPF0149 family protein [Candidatus Devosia phytovorans]|uniref:UPF0149 family protein n=1 Tax=Candidatus Devosia phytovorans TaxID=3121372 RepID=A0AAJ6AYQ7_9HYPH|nr:UPF0149 family protein [Devosia sp.]WEK03172.1 MAG: UPF0149 family protein [Devosia sp.]